MTTIPKTKSVRFRTTLLLTGVSFGSSACFDLPKGLQSTKGVSSKLVSTLSGAGDRDQSTIAGTVAIAEDFIAALKVSLGQLGLTSEQVSAVEQSARREVSASVVAIQSSSMSLTVDMVGSPLEYAAPAVIRGAVAGLAVVGTNEVATNLKTDAVKTVVGTAFKALNGKTQDLRPSAIESVAKNIAGGAVANLTAAGYTSDNVSSATKSVTSGSIANLKEAGIPSTEIAAIAKTVVSGAVEQLGAINLPPEKIATAVGGAAEGAVAAIKSTGLDSASTAQLAGTLTAATVESLVTIKSVNAAIFVSAVKQVSTSAISALKEASIADDIVLTAVKSISTASTSAVISATQNGSVSSEVMKSGISAITAGAISGLGTLVAESNAQLASTAASEIVSGSMTALAESTVVSSVDKVSIVVDVVSKSVAEVSSLRSDTSKTNVISSVIGSTMKSLDALGVVANEQDTASTLKAVSTSATAALASSGFTGQQLATVVSESVVGTLVKGIDNLKTGNGATLGTLVSSVMVGVASGVSTLKETGKTTANEAVAAVAAASESATNKVSELKVAQTLSSTELAAVTDTVVTVTPPSVSYAVASLSLTVGTTMEELVPSTSGKFTACSIAPSLPAGLDFSTSNCRISGTPTAVLAATTFTIKPNNDGLATQLKITVDPVSVAAKGASYFQNGFMLSTFGTGAQSSGGFQGWLLNTSPARVSGPATVLTTGYTVRK